MLDFSKYLNSNKLLFITILLLIIGFGSFARIWKINDNPPGLQYDEAYNGLDGLVAMENRDYKIFYPDNNGREGLYINALAISMKLFGVSNFSIRLVSAFFGILTLVGFYFLLKELKLSKISILLGVFLIATSFWHLNFSHTVYRAVMVPFLLVWLLYFFFFGN